MERRQLLGALGGTVAIALTGCLSEPGGPATDEDSTTDENPTTTEPSESLQTTTNGEKGWGPGGSEPFQTVRVGTRTDVDFPDNNRPPEIRIWNDAATEREVTITLRTPTSVRTSTTVTFPADGWLRMIVNEPASYALHVDIEGESAGELDIVGGFDCNETTANVTIHADGELSARTVSTEIACPGPEIRGNSFSTSNGSCDGSEDATVTFDDETVSVNGRIRTPTPCYNVELASVSLENAEEFTSSGEDVLVVTVASVGVTDDVCVDCIGSVPYRAAIDVANAYPHTVRVVHRSMNGTRTVTTATPGG